MKQTTVRFHWWGMPARPHNGRQKEYVNAVNSMHDLPKFNGLHEVWGPDRSLRDAYAETFGPVLEEYNARQKNWSRRMTVDDYMAKVEKDTRGKAPTVINTEGKRVIDPNQKKGKKTSYEIDVSIGNVTCKKTDENGKVLIDENGLEVGHPQAVPEEVNKAVLRRYYETFSERNPHLKMVRCDYHEDEGRWVTKAGEWVRDHPWRMDRDGNRVFDPISWERGTPHIHLEFFGVADGYKSGMPMRSAIDKALKQQGCRSMGEWADREREYIESVTQEVWAQYVADHPDYAAELTAEYGGTGLEIVHPDADEGDRVQLSAGAFSAMTELQEVKKDAELVVEKLAEREKEMNEKEKELQEREARLQEQAEKASADLDQIRADQILNQWEAAEQSADMFVQQRETDSDRKRANDLLKYAHDEVDRSKKGYAAREKVLNDRESCLDAREKDLDERERNLGRRESGLEAKEEAATQKWQKVSEKEAALDRSLDQWMEYLQVNGVPQGAEWGEKVHALGEKMAETQKAQNEAYRAAEEYYTLNNRLSESQEKLDRMITNLSSPEGQAAEMQAFMERAKRKDGTTMFDDFKVYELKQLQNAQNVQKEVQAAGQSLDRGRRMGFRKGTDYAGKPVETDEQRMQREARERQQRDLWHKHLRRDANAAANLVARSDAEEQARIHKAMTEDIGMQK